MNATMNELPEDYFDPAIQFVDENADYISQLLEDESFGGGFLIRGGYYENPSHMKNDIHRLEIEVAPKLSQAYMGEHDGTSIFSFYNFDVQEMATLLKKVESIYFSNNRRRNQGLLRIGGLWNDEWHITLVFHAEPFEDDEADNKVVMVRPKQNSNGQNSNG